MSPWIFPVPSRGRPLWRLIQAGRLAALLSALAAISLFGQAPAAAPAPADPVVQLPPMMIEESSKAPPWLYAAVGDTEYLSRVPLGVTREYIEARLTIGALLRTVIPEDFLAKYATPVVLVIVPKSAVPAGDDAVMREMSRMEDDQRRRQAAEAASRGQVFLPVRYQFLPNMRLDDRDMMGVFTVMDEAAFDGGRLTIAGDYVHALLSRRTPMLPQWLIEGLYGVYNQMELRATPITIRPMLWVSREETTALARDPESRRVLLPSAELFAPDALLGEGSNHPVRSAAWRAQAALFVRWALDPAHRGMREALWRLAERVSRERMTEALFTECFGFGYVDLLDRLSDYLPTAVKEPVLLPAVELPRLPRVELKPATPSQIGRLRGEWERLEISAVRQSHPQFIPRYAEKARQSFLRATSIGERDPQLIAAAGLCELDAGDVAAARPLLEEAVSKRVIRPRVYFELAKLRWLDLAHGTPVTRRFSAEQLQPILTPLREALGQTPLLPEVLLLTTEVWLRSAEPISSLELETLVAFAPRLRRYSYVGLQLALLQVTLGKGAEAGATLNASFPFVTEPAMQARYQQLHALLTRPPAGKK